MGAAKPQRLCVFVESSFLSVGQLLIANCTRDSRTGAQERVLDSVPSYRDQADMGLECDYNWHYSKKARGGRLLHQPGPQHADTSFLVMVTSVIKRNASYGLSILARG